ncbi:dipeptidyl peptidase 2 isoform X2 [Rhinatrema bivittatum]|uniref:dipeptidyl peptidase 2 isoform X2 n=1 Tax=Rhinatrema bivittatum TaxID=194408 RepID=UPI001126F2F4|nr:dipeptidyl peptidase 2 isoform X2 [Rhinatrema bivittatum]
MRVARSLLLLLLFLVRCLLERRTPPGAETVWPADKETLTLDDDVDEETAADEEIAAYEETETDKTIKELDFQEKFFRQLLDHFDFEMHGSKTFFQRYLITDQYWNKTIGPLFFYTGNEGDIWDSAKTSTFIVELAIEQKALVVFAEHFPTMDKTVMLQTPEKRYYGKSLLYENRSSERENIGLLSVEQALADYALLIKDIKAQYHAKNTPVIVFGGSYGGLLSAYMRLKYPDIVSGALASSAPLYSVAGIGDSGQFFADVTTIFEKCNPDCSAAVRDAFKNIRELYMQQEYDTIGRKMNICEKIETSDDLHQFYEFARYAFTMIAVMNYPYPTNFMGYFPANSVKVACSRILKHSDSIRGLQDLVGLLYNTTGEASCYDIYRQFTKCADPTGCGSGPESIMWDYQACTELNFLSGSNNVTDMFPNLPFTDSIREQYCYSKWHVRPRKDWLKTEFWGSDLKAASNIIFSNGYLDPWAGGGVKTNLTSTLIGIYIKCAGHQMDLRGSNKADPECITAARRKEGAIISKWVKDATIETAWETLTGIFADQSEETALTNP